MHQMFGRTSAFGVILGLVGALGAEPTLLDAGYHEMYNLQFDEAHGTFSEWQRLHPNDSMGAVSNATAYLFSELDHQHILQLEFLVHDNLFHTDSKVAVGPLFKQRFETALNRAAELAVREPEVPNSLFATLLCHGLRSQYLALIEKRYAASLREIKVARTLADQLLEAHPEYYDAWIVVGVENYILSTQSAPARWLLRLSGGQTQQRLGIDKLRLVAERGRYLAPFARFLLAVVALRDQNRDRARDLLEGLAREFPNNPLYTQKLVALSN